MERSLEIDGGDGCIRIQINLLSLNCRLKMVRVVHIMSYIFSTVKKLEQKRTAMNISLPCCVMKT